jgi:hypothetical protein
MTNTEVIPPPPVSLWRNRDYLLLWLAQAVSSLGTSCTQFDELVELAARAWVVPKSQLTTAVAQNEVIVGSCSLVGPALGSWLFSITRLLPFVTDALSSLILLGSLIFIRSPMQDERRTERHHLLLEVREGLTWLWSQKVIRSIFLISSYVNLTITASVLLVLGIVQQQHIPSVLYGLIVAAGGVGNLLGAALCPPLQRRIRFGKALGCALIVFVFVFPLYGFITMPLLLGVVFVGIALSDSIRAIFMDSYRFAVVPDALQGRVNGVYRLILFSVLTIGSSALGLSLEHLGVLPTVGIVWSGLLLITGLLFLSPHIRQATLPEA